MFEDALEASFVKLDALAVIILFLAPKKVNRQKKSVSIRDVLRFATTYGKHEKKRSKQERAKRVLPMKSEGRNFSTTQSTNPTALPSVM